MAVISDSSSTEPPGHDARIVRAAIHPAIGVARVGDSADEFFLAPETEDEPPLPTGSYKDATGALKRQAARFRIYGYNAAGEPVAELTEDNAEVRWTVHVANKKAAWYQFQLALDIPEAAQADESQLRNPLVAGPDRPRLSIDPGCRSVRGRDRAGGPELRFDTGRFLRIPVYLGELRTDGAGRLIFLGGRGVAESVDFKEADTFANNDGWYDDISDGPVTAEVHVDGRALPVEPAWVVVGPPNYAPELKSVRTLYDLVRDAFTTAGALPEPEQVSFTHDILPILRRLCDLQWVNQGLATLFGHGGREYFLDPGLLAALADPSPRHEELRRQISKTMRDPDRDGTSPIPWPPVYGDAMSLPPSPHASTWPSPRSRQGCWCAGPAETSSPTTSSGPRPRPRNSTGCRSPPDPPPWTARPCPSASPMPSTRAAKSPGRCATPRCTARRSASATARRATPSAPTAGCSPRRPPRRTTGRCTARNPAA